MKSFYILPGLLLCIVLNATSLKAQDTSDDDDSTGLPGDNFSLPGALELFKKASSPEEFEKSLNTEDSKVNNLDLNNDGNTDYIRVIDKKENNVHVFILQALVSDNESQDIAVIELEKTGANSAVVQITGDEDIYGEEKIVEPGDGADNAWNMATSPTVARGPNAFDTEFYDSGAGIIVNVWAWPCVRFVYAPAYVVWVSPWGWAHRPLWWRPWRPMYWAVYRPIRYNYYRHYTVVHTHRVVYAQRMYRPARVTSVTVRTRNQVAVNSYRVNRTTQRRTVTTANGNKYQVTKRTTTVNGRHGRASHSTTTVRRRRR